MRNRHHRKPQSLGGTNEPRNISRVSIRRHNLWHRMFGNRNPQQICEEINRRWLDPDYRFVVERK